MNFNKASLALLVAILFSTSLHAQQWVDMMMDPNANFHETQAEFNAYWENRPYEKGKGFKQFKRWEYMMERRVNQNGELNVSKDYFDAMFKDQSTAKSISDSASWNPLGPFGAAYGGGAGRLNCVAFQPGNSNQVYAGAPSGGIWRSYDNGQNWHALTGQLENLGITDIAIDPFNGNIMYAGTGDADGGDVPSYGVIKSTDGGYTWQPTGYSLNQSNNKLVYRLQIHPTNNSILYLASYNGFYKTTDAGDTWTRVKTGSYRDFAFKPGNPDVIYLASSSTIYRTEDAGDSWTTLNYNPVSSVRRIVLAVTPADPNYLYVLAGRQSDNGFGGLYRSTDGGTTFTTMSTTPNVLGWSRHGTDSGGQAWYDLALAVSPTNKELVTVGGVNIWRSLNGGTSWILSAHWTGNGASYVHADIHRLTYAPGTNTLWACTDGGAARTQNNGALWTEYNNGLNIAQIYRFGGSATVRNKIISGWQDNGSNFLDGVSWKSVLGGDGMECLIDYTSNQTIYGSLYYGAIRRSTDGGLSWTSISDNIQDNGAWVTPFVQDPNVPNTLYAGFTEVWKTTDQGNTWSKISNFSGSSYIRGLAVAPSNSDIIYVISDSKVRYTSNGGSTWSDISPSGASGSNSYITLHPQDPNTAYITKSGYTGSSKVWVTNDAGQNWTNITANLPNVPANCIILEKNTHNRVYVGTDLGVYMTDTTMTDWSSFNTGLPKVIVNEMEIFYPANTLRAATYGRGVWETPLKGLNTSIQQDSKKELSLKLYPNPADDRITLELNNLQDGDYEFTVEVYSQLGAKVKELNFHNRSQVHISIGELNKGIYLVKLFNNKTYITKKLIVK